MVLSIVWSAPSSAFAHHILGLPHYKYGDDYPQIPYVEIMAQVGPHDLYFTYFPGTPKPGDRIRFKLYVKNRVTGEPFRQPLEVSYVKSRTIRSDVVLRDRVAITTGVGPEANDYKFFYTFDDADAYEVRLRFPNGDDIEVIPFPVHIGETDTRPLLFGAVAILGLAIITVAGLKRRQRRRGKRTRKGKIGRLGQSSDTNEGAAL